MIIRYAYLVFVLLCLCNLPVNADTMERDQAGNNAAQAYIMCNNALVTGNAEIVYSCLSVRLRQQTKQTVTLETIRQQLSSMAKLAVQDVSVSDFYMIKDTVNLNVNGNVQEFKTGQRSMQKGIVTMRIENGIWRIVRERWGIQG